MERIKSWLTANPAGAGALSGLVATLVATLLGVPQDVVHGCLRLVAPLAGLFG